MLIFFKDIPGTSKENLASLFALGCMHKGVLVVHTGRETVKLGPLTIRRCYHRGCRCYGSSYRGDFSEVAICFRHTGIIVNDIYEWSYFFDKILGFQLLSDVVESGSHLNSSLGLSDVHVHVMKFADRMGFIIELLCFKSHVDKYSCSSQAYSVGIRHIALTVNDIELITSLFKDRYGDSQGEISISNDGRVKMVYLKGPEGCLFELVEEIL